MAAGSSAGKLGGQLVLDLLDQRVAFRLAVGLGVQRILEAVADLGLQLGVVGFVELRRGKGALGLAGHGNQLVDGGDNLLDLRVRKLDGGQDHFFGLFLGARLDHHDAVFVADNHDVDRGGRALGVGGIDDELAIDAAHANRANRGAERNVRERQRAGGGIDADHVGIVFLVGGEDQRDDLRLVAEAVGEQRADGAIDLAAGQNFLFAGPAFALDESAGNAPAGIGVLAVIDGEGEEVDAFPGSGEATAVARTTVSPVVTSAAPEACLAMRPVSKTSRLPPASSTATSCFRHRVLVSFLFAWETCGGKRRRVLESGRMAGARKRAGCARGADSPGLRVGRAPGRAQPIAVRRPWQRVAIRQVHHGPRFWVERGP